MRVAARGLTFDVRVAGPADATGTVLLLHGFPQHGGSWDRVVPALHAAGLRTVAPDQRGYSPDARPAEPAGYALGELGADALAILDALALPGPAHVVGHDWGSVVGWYLAGTAPERVATLTAVSVPHPAALTAAIATDADQRQRSAYIRLFRVPGQAEEVLLADGAGALRGVFAGSGLDEAGVDTYVAPLLAPGALTGALNWYRAMGADLAAVGPARVPVTYVWSDEDLAVGRTAARDCARFATDDYRFVPLAGISHWIPDQVPDALAAEILARVDPPA